MDESSSSPERLHPGTPAEENAQIFTSGPSYRACSRCSHKHSDTFFSIDGSNFHGAQAGLWHGENGKSARFRRMAYNSTCFCNTFMSCSTGGATYYFDTTFCQFARCYCPDTRPCLVVDRHDHS